MSALAVPSAAYAPADFEKSNDIEDGLARLGFPRAVLVVAGHLARWALTPPRLAKVQAEGKFLDREPCTVTESLAQIAASVGCFGKDKGRRTVRRALSVLCHYKIVHKVQRKWQTSKLIVDYGALKRLTSMQADEATRAQVKANVELAYHGEEEAARRAAARAARAAARAGMALDVPPPSAKSTTTRASGPLTEEEQHAIVREALGEHWTLQHSILPRRSRRMWRETGAPEAAAWRDQWRLVRAALDDCQAPIWRILRFEIPPPHKNHSASVLSTPLHWEQRVKAARAHADGRCACHAAATAATAAKATPAAVPVAPPEEHELVLDLEPDQVATLASDPVTAWSLALGELVRHLDPHDVETWLVPTRLLVSGGRAVLKVPNEPWAEFVHDFFRRPVERVLAGMA